MRCPLSTNVCLSSFRYKRELSSAMEREAALERSKAQLELDWQRRHEDTERHSYEKSEDLVRRLTRARDEVRILTTIVVCFTQIGRFFVKEYFMFGFVKRNRLD